MDADWVTSSAARRILVHWADPRPAWLWSADVTTLIWRNAAARYFNAKVKKSGPRLSPEAIPIKGQVARLVRLGAPGRSSLSRIQFLVGDRPISTTCTVTPLELSAGQLAVLIVAVDPIEAELLGLLPEHAEPIVEALLPPRVPYLLLDPDGQAVAGSADLAEALLPATGTEASSIEIDGRMVTPIRLKASPQGHQLALLEGANPTIADVRLDDGIVAEPAPRAEADTEPHLPMELPVTEMEPPEPKPPVAEEPAGESLSSLFDRLADNETLYGELTEADEVFPREGSAAAALEAGSQTEPDESATFSSEPDASSDLPGGDEITSAPTASTEPDVIAAVIAFEDDLDDVGRTTFRVIGRGFTPLETPAPVAEPPTVEMETVAPAEDAGEPSPPTPAEIAQVDRTSRYNFDELSRILTDRVGGEPVTPTEAEAKPETPAEPLRALPMAVSEGALINIAAETFILNRLPLGILVFRDQQVLFANRSLTDLVGHESIDGVRAAGIAAIFPGDDSGNAGPVTQLVRRDGARIPVTARLQSITWQGRPALMLSASAAEVRTGHEAAVRSFAEAEAEARADGFVATDRNGVITLVSSRARVVLGRIEDDLTGTPLATLIQPDDLASFREFLERPARFAETARPSIVLRTLVAGADLLLYAEGQAGIVSGYFGFLRKAVVAPAATPAPTPSDEDDADPSMLARISRSVRRPLNTIVGFADLIRSASFGAVDNHRYVEYARDIKTAGQEIAVLIDELEDYSRLKSGKYAARLADLDLAALLDSCVVRVRGHAGAARVLVRSAISERLPRIRADRASLGQAILNLLASGIDQTPAGGQVILSAQPDEQGGILVNVRDSGTASADLGERFVVFRDGVGKDGEALAPVRSSVGLALTRSLVSVNACTLSVDPAGAVGTLFSIAIPPDLVAAAS